MSSKARRAEVGQFSMSLSFTHLGTGSRGNATLVESGDAKVLIDQGFSLVDKIGMQHFVKGTVAAQKKQ